MHDVLKRDVLALIVHKDPRDPSTWRKRRMGDGDGLEETPAFSIVFLGAVLQLHHHNTLVSGT